MQQFEHNGILYEELPNGKARVIGPAGQAPMESPPAFVPPSPNSPRAQERAQDQQRENTRTNLAINADQRAEREANKPDFIPQGATHMLGPDGTAVPIPGVSATNKQQETAKSLLTAAGVDIERGIDPIAELIKGSTSGPIQHIGAQAYGAVTGDATDGMENIARLKTVASDLTLQLTGGSLGSQISNSDREFIVERVGNIADPNVPADARLAAWEQVKQRMANIVGVQPRPQTDEDFRRGIEERIKRGDSPAATIKWLIDSGRPPDEETIAAIVANANNQRPDVRPPEPDPNARAFGVGARGAIQGPGDILNMVSSPFIQGINAVTGSNLNPDMGDNLSDMLSLPEPQTGTEHLIHEANRFGTGGLSFAGLARRAAPYVAGAAEHVGNALQRIGNAPLTDMVSATTGGMAAETARQQGAPPAVQALTGIATGGVTAPMAMRAGQSRVANALVGGPEMAPPPVVRAGRQEGVTVNRAMADPSTDTKTTAVGKTFVGSRMMHGNMNRINDQIEGRVQSLGRDGSPFQEPAATGGAVQNIGRRYIKTSGAEFKKHYGDLRKQAADVPIAANETVAHIDGILARLNKAPNQNAAEIKYLEGVKADIANGIDVETARDIGSRLSRDISKGDITFGPHEAAVLDVRKALARDTENGLATAGKPEVAARYRDVDAAYSARMDFIKRKLQGLLGKRNAPLDPEKAAGRLRNMAGERGDASGIYQILGKATPEERADIAATFAHSLGRDKDGAFSTAKFVRDLSAMPLSARVAIFGKDGAKSLDNLKTIASEHKRVSARLGGSPTALATDWRGYLYNFILGSVPGAMTGNVGTGAALAGAGLGVKAARDAMGARMLMSPKVTNWLRTAPRTTDPKAINEHWSRLSAIAVREPALGPDIQRFQEAFMRAANENVTPRLTAEEGDQDN